MEHQHGRWGGCSHDHGTSHDHAGYGPGSQERRNSSRPGTRAPVLFLALPFELGLSITAFLFLAMAWSLDTFAPSVARPVILALYLACYVSGGWDLIVHLVSQIGRFAFRFNVDLLMLVAAVGAAALGEWTDGGFLLCLFSLAHALEHLAMDRARSAIQALEKLAPSTAIVVRDGEQRTVPLGEIQMGDEIVIRPGDRVAVDGVILSGRSALDQSAMTGESVPVVKSVGEDVFAGTLNADGMLHIRATQILGDRMLDRVVAMVEQAQSQRAPVQRWMEAFERTYVPAVLISVLLVIIVPPLAGVWTWPTALYRGLTFLVGCSPCALALGTPAAVICGIAQAARNGVLVKGGKHLEQLSRTRAMAFDKTGTLTRGRPEVTSVRPWASTTETELLTFAVAVERSLTHPLATAIVRYAERRGVAATLTTESLENVQGYGVRSIVDGQSVEVGALRMWGLAELAPIPEDETRAFVEAVREMEAAGATVAGVRAGDRWLGLIGMADEPRPEAATTLAELNSLHIRPLVMLTGDNPRAASLIAKLVGVTEVRAGLLPLGKVEAIRQLKETSGDIAMVGDGINDAPALAAAGLGIAMGGIGSQAALESADIVLMADKLEMLPYAVRLSRATQGIIRQNTAIAVGVMIVLSITTLTGVTSMGPAVIFHEGSTLVVLANALRLFLFRPRRKRGAAPPRERDEYCVNTEKMRQH